MTEKMDIRKPRLPSDVGWHDIEISDNKTQNLVWWNERNGRDLDKPTRKRKRPPLLRDDRCQAETCGRVEGRGACGRGLMLEVLTLTREERIGRKR
jgi:hypothetical protein